MTRTATATLAAAGAALFGAVVLSMATPHGGWSAPGLPAPRATSAQPSQAGVLPIMASPQPGVSVAGVAERWVTAMWTRRPGDSPFSWLGRVADITSPALASELRSARTTVADRAVISATVDIDGVYADAVDPATVTVTCVAHLLTAAGRRDLPCATTVTASRGGDGRVVVSRVA